MRFFLLLRAFSAFPHFNFKHMKSLKDYSMNLTEQEYHAYPAWSYSTIVRYAKNGFGAIATLHEPVSPTPSMEFGSLFDTIITKSKKEFYDEYSISDVVPPTAEKGVLDALLTKTDQHFFSIPTSIIEEAIDECSYQKRWSFEAQYKHLSEYSEYYESRLGGKSVVTRRDFEDAIEMAKVMWESDNTKDIFKKGTHGDVEYIYQAQFCEDYLLDSGKEVKIKIMPDLLIVNHEDMTIQPIDLKTSSIPGWQFKDNFLKFRYDIQAELYTDIIRLVIDKDMDYRSYTIKPYIFADISRSDKLPVTYEYDPTNGLSFESNGKTYTYKRWPELLEEILNYEEQQAKVPSYISLSEPNDLISILSR